MNKTKIDWPGLTHTWNPITGCSRGCSYCYARRIHERFNKTPFSDIVYHEDRLLQPMKEKRPSVIFVGSMSDIEYWPENEALAILEICEATPQHTFMFLSKSPLSYDGFKWPKNTMQGLTNSCENTKDNQMMRFMTMIRHCPRPYLSIEPLLGRLQVSKMMHLFELVIVGAMTGPGAVQPEKEWIQSIRDNVPLEKIHFKQNILRLL